MKKYLSLFLGIFVALSAMATPASAFEGGTGAVSSPYMISSVAGLIEAVHNPGGNYILMNDIEIDYFESGTAIGTDEEPFSGTFDGNGHAIIFNNSTTDGLFGNIGASGTVKNLYIKSNVIGSKTTGILANKNSGNIFNCEVYGAIQNSNYEDGASVGGVVGYNSGNIENCLSIVNNVKGGASVGGFSGTTAAGNIKNCYSVCGDISGGVAAAFVGTSSATTLSGCYYDSTNASLGVAVGSDATNGKSNTELKSLATFNGFDFGSTWVIADGYMMPRLKSVFGNGTYDDPYKIRTSDDFCSINGLGCGDAGKYTYFKQNHNISSLDAGLIGSDVRPFMGNYDGDGTYIYDLKHSNNGTKNVGLFNVIASSGMVSNVTVVNTKVAGDEVVGAISGVNYGIISGCYVKTEANYNNGVSGIKDVGGITGQNYGTVTACSNLSNITAKQSGAGGIAGWNNGGTISECINSSNDVNASDHGTGGITGDNSRGTVLNCISQNAVLRSVSEAGGIAGRLYNGTITNCYNSSKVSSGDANVGGIIGGYVEGGDVNNSYYSINSDYNYYSKADQTLNQYGAYVSEEDVKNNGGLYGFDFSDTWIMLDGIPYLQTIVGAGTQARPFIIHMYTPYLISKLRNSNAYFKLAHDITSNINIEKFSGILDGQGHKANLIIETLASGAYIGNVTFTDKIVTTNNGTIEYCRSNSSSSGVICDKNDGGTIKNCSSVGKISKNGGLAESNVNGGVIQNCVVYGSVRGNGNMVGGIVGNNNSGVITDSAFYGSINGNSMVGGIAGRNDNNGKISGCGAECNITSNSVASYVGGLCGMNYANISGSTAICTAFTPTVGENIGTFCGLNEGNITGCKVKNATGSTVDVIIGGGVISGVDVIDYADYSGFPSVAVGGTYLSVSTPNYSPEQNGGLSDISGHWAEATIKNLVARGVVSGYEDNTFRPENPVTKGEFIKLLIESRGVTINNIASVYTDVNSDWSAPYVNTAIALGICDNIATSSTEFGVNEPISRAQAGALIGRIINPSFSGTPSFTDNAQIPDWALSPIEQAVEAGIITGNPDGTYAPNNNLTRAEAATIVERL